MKILYFCNVRKSNPTESGVLKKVLAQCKVMRKAGHTVYLACLESDNYYTIVNDSNKELYSFSLSGVQRMKRDKYIFSQLSSFVIPEGIQVLYSRYSNFSLEAHRFYKRLKKNGIHCILEIPTYPLTQRWTTIKQNFCSFHFKKAVIQTYYSTIGTLGIFFFKYSLERIANNNGYKTIWGVPVLSITNGIDVSSIPLRHHDYDINNRKIIIVSVANIAKWHGFDRFIKGLHEYYKEIRDVKVELELAGPGDEVETLKKMTENFGLSDYIKFLGPQFGVELNELFNRADIGISILGIHRSHQYTIDCLKSREFCARQLPFITQSAEKHFEGTRFSLIIPSDETPIDIGKVIEFYKNIANNPSILQEMYSFAVEKCDWSVAFNGVINYINKIDNDCSVNRR